MFIEVLAAVLAGVILGAVTGIAPGLHVNMAALLAATLLAHASPVLLAAFILAMSISHVFHEFLPSTFLGASESETALAVLPGHKMLLQGRGREATLTAGFGCLTGVIALSVLSPLLLPALKVAFDLARKQVLPMLGLAILAQVLRSRKLRTTAIKAGVITLSGLLGLATFSIPNLNQPLLPMLTGLFGLASLIGGLLQQISVPEQAQKADIRTGGLLTKVKLTVFGLLSSLLMSLFPALGPAQAAMLGTLFAGKISSRHYLFLLGTISSASMLAALITLSSFGKARNGSIAVIGEIIEPTGSLLAWLLLVSLITASLSLISVIFLSKAFSFLMLKVRYSFLASTVILSVISLTLLISGLTGVMVLLAATSVGLIPVLTRTSRQPLMGCLMVPVMGYYL